MQIVAQQEMFDHTFLTLREKPDGPYYVAKLHTQEHNCNATRCEGRKEAEDWVQYQMGYLALWSGVIVKDDDHPEFKRGWDAAGEDAYLQAMQEQDEAYDRINAWLF